MRCERHHDQQREGPEAPTSPSRHTHQPPFQRDNDIITTLPHLCDLWGFMLRDRGAHEAVVRHDVGGEATQHHQPRAALNQRPVPTTLRLLEAMDSIKISVVSLEAQRRCKPWLNHKQSESPQT